MSRSRRNALKTLVHASAGVVILGALLCSSADAQTQSGPLTIAKQGWFFVGGKIDPKLPGSPIVDQMYVEYQVPQNQTHPYPVVMIHGGGQTGTNFTGTPDGREGWAQYFLRRGYAVYVVDQVARGRSAEWSQANGPVTAANLERLEERFVAPERFKLWPQAHLHTQWPGNGQPGDAGLRPVLCEPGSLAREFHHAAGPQQRCRRCAARPDRPRGAADPFAVRRLRMADRRPAAQPRQGDHRGRAQRPARPRPRFQGRAGLVCRQSAHQAFWPWRGAAHLRAAGHGCRPAQFVHEDKPEKPDLARCWAQQEPARKLVKLQEHPVADRDFGSLLSCLLRSLHGALSRSGRRQEHPSAPCPTPAFTATGT